MLRTLLALVLFWPRWALRRARVRRAALVHLGMAARRGLPLSPALRALAREHADRRGGRDAAVLDRLAGELDQGGSLARALDTEPLLFPPALRELVRRAESQGALPAGLDVALAEEEEHGAAGVTLLGALAYPLYVVPACLATAAFLGETIYPRLEEVMLSMSAGVPGAPRGAAALVSDLSLLLVVGLVGAFLTLVLDARSGRRVLSRTAWALLRRVPGLGRLVHQRDLGRCLRRASALVAVGSTLPEALGVTRDVAPSRETARAFDAAQARARAGDPLPLVLEAALGRAAPTHLPALLLRVERAGLAEGLAVQASGLLSRSEAALRTVGRAARPLTFTPCLVLAALHAHVFWSYTLTIQRLVMETIP